MEYSHDQFTDSPSLSTMALNVTAKKLMSMHILPAAFYIYTDHPQSNGLAEKSVKKVKQLLRTFQIHARKLQSNPSCTWV